MKVYRIGYENSLTFVNKGGRVGHRELKTVNPPTSTRCRTLRAFFNHFMVRFEHGFLKSETLTSEIKRSLSVT